ncbi:MAG TPA: hypothetical protein VFK05_21135 [Polyangiaceae bacterium]|nr:hypothetical protein [Polyangiaceae bacterium]
MTELLVKYLTENQANARSAPSLLEAILGPIADESTHDVLPLSAQHFAALASSDDD